MLTFLRNATACTSRSPLGLKVYFQLVGKHSFWLVMHWIEGEPVDG